MEKMKSIAATAIAAGALLMSGQAALAASYYVATTGSDSNSGSATSPFLTLQRGVNAAAAGDTIIVRDGTYGPTGGGGSMGVNILKAGSSGAWITLKAEHKGAAILDCKLICHSYVNFGAGSAYWVLQDFDIRNGANGGVWSNNGGGKNIRLQGNRIHHIANYYSTTSGGLVGIYTDEIASNWVINGNVFHDIGRDGGLPSANHDHGIYTHGTNMLITNNVFYNDRFGWHIQTVGGFSGTIANNIFFGPAGTNLPGSIGSIVLWQNNSNVIIRNNIFYNPLTAGIYTYNWSISGYCYIDHNFVFNDSGGMSLIYPSLPSGCAASNNSLNVNPKLVTPSLPNYDFRLQAGSPAIDAGISVAGVSSDFDGAARPQGAAYDIGAFEYGGLQAPPAADTTAPLISAVAASAVSQTGATIGWTTNEAADTLVEYGPTTAYGASTVLNSALSTSHGAVLSALTAGTLYHYRVKSRDAAGNLATSPDAAFTTSAPAPSGACINSAGAWANAAFAPQTGAFTVEYDAVPGAANIDGVSGLSNGAAAGYGALAAAVRFNNAGRIDAINGVSYYMAAAAVPYVAGLSYHFRLVVNVPAHTYSAYVKQGANAEQLLGGNYAFRPEQAAVATLNNLGLYSSSGSQSICGVAVTASAAPADAAAPVISAVAASAVSQTGATIGWTTNEAADTLVEYGPTTAYGASTPLNATLSTAHSAALGGLTAGTLYHYRVKSRDAASNLATSPDATFTTAAPAPIGACINSAGAWANAAFAAQTGAFTVEFDAVPGAANIDGVSGLSNGAAAGYGALAAAVRFNNAGRIDAINGVSYYMAAAAVPYVAGLSYHFRLVVNVPAHTYSAYVKQGANAEQLLGGNYAFRPEQAAVATLSNLGLYSSSGSQSICGVAVTASAAPADTAAPLISAVAASAVSQTGATIGWTTNEAADTLVEYGPTTAYGASTVLNSALSTSHGAVLSGLTAGTLYHYRVKSRDAAGNLAASPDATFTTAAPADTAAPLIIAVAASAVSQTGAAIGWTTNEAADTLVEYGPTTAYGASTPLNAALSTAHSAALSGLTAGTLYHYRVKSRDAAGNLATSPDATFATAAPAPAPAPAACINSAGSWANAAFAAQTGAFTVEYDAIPGLANMDGVSGLSNGAAAGYGALAVSVRFNNSGRIDAINGAAYYKAAGDIRYVAGLTYRIRLVVNVPARTYSAYVKQGVNAEQMIGASYAFRTEQNTATTLNNLGALAAKGSLSACGVIVK